MDDSLEEVKEKYISNAKNVITNNNYNYNCLDNLHVSPNTHPIKNYHYFSATSASSNIKFYTNQFIF